MNRTTYTVDGHSYTLAAAKQIAQALSAKTSEPVHVIEHADAEAGCSEQAVATYVSGERV